LYVSTFNRLSNRQPEEAQKHNPNSKNEGPKYAEKTLSQEKLEEKEIKQYTLRPQSSEKTSHRKNNSNILPSNKYLKALVENEPSQGDKQTKPSLQVEIENYLSTSTPKDKIPRSSSANNMKGVKSTTSPKLQPDSQSRKLQTYNPLSNILITSPKPLKPASYGLSPSRATDSGRNEKSNKAILSPSQRPSTQQSPIFDLSQAGGSKSEYLKSLFHSSKKEGTSKDQSKSQKSSLNKSNCVNGNNDNVEEVSSKNYKFLEIRNNQYVFLNQ